MTLSARLVAAKVRCCVVDLTAAACFARAEWFAIFVVWAAANWFDMEWLVTGADACVLGASGLATQEWTFFVSWIVEIRQEIVGLFGGGDASWVLLQETVEDLVAYVVALDVGAVAVKLTRKSNWVVAFVIEQVGNEGIHGLEGLLTWRLFVD